MLSIKECELSMLDKIELLQAGVYENKIPAKMFSIRK